MKKYRIHFILIYLSLSLLGCGRSFIDNFGVRDVIILSFGVVVVVGFDILANKLDKIISLLENIGREQQWGQASEIRYFILSG